MPDQKALKFSDAYEQKDSSGMYGWSAVMLNINAGHNQELMDNCKALRHYALYVAKVKAYSKEMTIDAAVDKAVEEAIQEAEFIANRWAEGLTEAFEKFLHVFLIMNL